MPATTCRKATPDDLPILCALGQILNRQHHAAQPDFYRDATTDLERDAPHWRPSLEDGLAAAFIAEQDGRPVGFITTRIVKPASPLLADTVAGRIDSVAVMEGYRGQGIGRLLVKTAESWTIAQGARDLRLTVWDFNTDARRLYEALGYTARACEMGKKP